MSNRLIARNLSSKSTNGDTNTTNGAVNQTNISTLQRLRVVFRDYGTCAIIFHIAVSLLSVGCWYMVVESGIDIKTWMQKIGFSEKFLQSVFTTSAGTFIVAYAIHKTTAIPRAMLTISVTPLIVRHLRRIGWMRKPVVAASASPKVSKP
ncbi:uncharacterized protein TRIADDRAFT_30605 [Trichoplax adhaerens]|uniref:DUF1279 domain-containing protein n=1 Tax=Trichoplax adhaerens TaxID=10228 RepID=B3S7G3_TRIAD|nr:hypothetical protein TRIADDRAFT_30605 [Trichoplax adhaerens]EDV21194.1 hypothetical protein TRIADDRAFT_30605 [Trichoplax adhaerens]|eukprot:XP_002116161.1 hypothetical protein TRIADDRAFT_30605 [Trichoplax adhaerens]